MRLIAKQIPNALTCANLISGCLACIAALDGNYWHVTMYLFIAVGFDFADGLAARILHAVSPIGKDLDSLADMVSFGLAPGLMLFRFINDTFREQIPADTFISKWFYIAAFAIPVFSALRLARFNNDPRQVSSFIGLPVPAHAIFWTSLISSLTAPDGLVYQDLFFSFFGYSPRPFFLLAGLSVLALATSLLLVSEIPMFSLKVKSLTWKGNEQRYLLIFAAIVLIVWLGMAGITATILLYILLSILNRRKYNS